MRPEPASSATPTAVDSSRPRRLQLFSGPASRADSLSGVLRQVGWEVRDIDVLNAGSDHAICQMMPCGE
eukprot:9404236-Alexandrium_andersonii.AAC.1